MRVREILSAKSIGEVFTIWGSTPMSASVENVLPAIPGWLLIPAPTRLTLPRSSRDDH